MGRAVGVLCSTGGRECCVRPTSTLGAARMSSSLSRSEIHALAGEAFTYLYPLVTMDITRAQLTDGQPKDMHGDPNAFAHVRTFPAAEFRDVVRPNFDTLYS